MVYILHNCLRIPFGVASAPAIFQRMMENLLRGYLDDILVTGLTTEEHLSSLSVLECLEQANLRLKRSKCSFLRSRIEYLGHIIDGEGLHPTDEMIEAIREAPAP